MNMKRMMPVLSGAACLLALLGSEVANAQPKIPLVAFYSPSKRDYFTTSNPNWTCTYLGNCASGATTPPDATYVAIGMQGHVYNPALAAPAGTVPLYSWFSASRNDRFLTSNPAWAATVGTVRDGYTLIRIEGHIPTGGSLQLKSYWNAEHTDNATLATWRTATPSGYSHFRTEGSLLPPDQWNCSGTPYTERHDAHANQVTRWNSGMGFLDGDRFRFTAPDEKYRFGHWLDNEAPIRGNAGGIAGSTFPAPGLTLRALLARVTSGRVFTARGWHEANQWFLALGDRENWDGPCNYYEAIAGRPGYIEFAFNDDGLSDNAGAAHLSIQQWW